MAHDPRKTVPMPKGDPKKLASSRKTEPMGLARDTIKNAPDHDYGFPVEPGPRGTIPMRGKNAAEIVIGVGKRPLREDADKIDVSKADPRRAPTQKVSRRPSSYLPTDYKEIEDEETQRRRARAAVSHSSVMGIALVVILGLLAVVLGLLVLKQRGTFG